MIRFKQKDTVRVYHTTRKENLPSIFKDGLMTKYQKNREFENKSLGLGLMSTPMIYLSKSLEHLCIPPNKNRVVLQIDMPLEVYKKLERVNKGDPAFQYYIKNKSKFKSWKNFCYYMFEEMDRQDPKLKESCKKEILEYGSLENTPRFKHALSTEKACSPSYCLMSSIDIPSGWILKDTLTEEQLGRMGIYFGV